MHTGITPSRQALNCSGSSISLQACCRNLALGTHNQSDNSQTCACQATPSGPIFCLAEAVTRRSSVLSTATWVHDGREWSGGLAFWSPGRIRRPASCLGGFQLTPLALLYPGLPAPLLVLDPCCRIFMPAMQPNQCLAATS